MSSPGSAVPPSDLEGIRAAISASNPQLYRHLALYLQVLRQVLPERVDQACFHLATQVHAARYLRLSRRERLALHRRRHTLIQRCCSLLTVEQLEALARSMVREAQQQQSEQEQQLLTRLVRQAQGRSGSDAGDDASVGASSEDDGFRAEAADLPPGSVRLDLSLPLSPGRFAWPESIGSPSQSSRVDDPGDEADEAGDELGDGFGDEDDQDDREDNPWLRALQHPSQIFGRAYEDAFEDEPFDDDLTEDESVNGRENEDSDGRKPIRSASEEPHLSDQGIGAISESVGDQTGADATEYATDHASDDDTDIDATDGAIHDGEDQARPQRGHDSAQGGGARPPLSGKTSGETPVLRSQPHGAQPDPERPYPGAWRSPQGGGASGPNDPGSTPPSDSADASTGDDAAQSSAGDDSDPAEAEIAAIFAAAAAASAAMGLTSPPSSGSARRQSSPSVSSDPRPDRPSAGSPSADRSTPELPPPWNRTGPPGDPILLLQWLEGLEKALARRLRLLSHAINVDLLRFGLSRGLLPVNLLDAVLQGQIETMASPANVLRLQLPFGLRPGAPPLQALAILVRQADLEMEEPRLRTCRRRLHQHRQEVRRMAQQYRRLQRRQQAHEAERLWLQDIRRSLPPRS